MSRFSHACRTGLLVLASLSATAPVAHGQDRKIFSVEEVLGENGPADGTTISIAGFVRPAPGHLNHYLLSETAEDGAVCEGGGAKLWFRLSAAEQRSLVGVRPQYPIELVMNGRFRRVHPGWLSASPASSCPGSLEKVELWIVSGS